MCTQCSINTGLIPPVFAWLHVASAASAMRRLATTYRRGGSASCRLNRFCRISCRCTKEQHQRLGSSPAPAIPLNYNAVSLVGGPCTCHTGIIRFDIRTP
ncbi:hypothetical protein J3E69DRAFT_341459 [Trichoderma sp. SZMC 28015]